MSRLRQILIAIVTPISATVAISLLIALVGPLKALLVDFEGGPLWEGPDGKPPLAFVIDTGSFTPLSSFTNLPDRPLATESQANRCGHRPNDLDPFGCIFRPDGHQVGPSFWSSSLRLPVSLCREDDSVAYRWSVRNPGHGRRRFDRSRVEDSDLRCYLPQRHSLCD